MMLFVLLLILTISETGIMRSRAAILGHVPILLLLTILPGTMALFRKTTFWHSLQIKYQKSLGRGYALGLFSL